MSSLSTLPPELLEQVYQRLAYSVNSLKELSSYLTINHAALSCLQPYLYRTIIVDSRSGDYLSQLLRTLLEGKSPAWLETHVRHLYIPYSGTSIGKGISILNRCSGITRLVCWLDAHDDKQLAKAINGLPCLEMLEINCKHFAYLLTMKIPSLPVWKDRLTHLALLVWDHLAESKQDWTIQRLSLEGFSSLTHVAVNTRTTPDLFCFPLLQTAPPSLVVLAVSGDAVTDSDLACGDGNLFIQAMFPQCGHDNRLVYFSESADIQVIHALGIAMEEQPYEASRRSPLDDWGQIPHSKDGSRLKFWSWARDAMIKGNRVFSRPVHP
ncbi:hypothetical protein DL96DRAFT_1549627 [Flagelloscypha sp. PMI_526]|nr:hypothetical protein DL96DRAFT_1549627 [Flagelloscypha sp. PMI_526]